MKRKILCPFNIFCFAVILLCAVSVLLCFVFFRDQSFADGFNVTVGRGVRIILAKITDPLPFSFGEFLLFSSPVLLFALCITVYRLSRRSAKNAVRCFAAVILTAAVIWCTFIIDFSSGYRGTSLAEKMKLCERSISSDDLYRTTEIILEELNKTAESVVFLPDGSGVMPFSLDEMSEKLCNSYSEICDEYGFIDNYKTKVKPLIISEYMTYTHISGIYTFFTGEANLNTNYPDYVCVFSAAHEMAHQRGISREDEANFIAFLVCKNSDDEYIRYCAYLNMYEYLSSALYSSSPELYAKAYAELSPEVRGDLAAYSAFFDKYRENTAADVSDSLNNAYLEIQGTEGVISYDMVTKLAVFYYLD